MFKQIISFLKLNRSVGKSLSRTRLIVNVILLIMALFTLQELYILVSKATMDFVPYADSFKDYSIIVRPNFAGGSVYKNYDELSSVLMYDADTMFFQFKSKFDYYLFKSKDLVFVMLILILFYHLRKLVYSIDQKDVFSEKTIFCLKTVSTYLIFFGLAFVLLNVSYSEFMIMYFNKILAQIKFQGFVYLGRNENMMFSNLLAGFIILLGIVLRAVSNAFILGQKLKVENDLTV